MSELVFISRSCLHSVIDDSLHEIKRVSFRRRADCPAIHHHSSSEVPPIHLCFWFYNAAACVKSVSCGEHFGRQIR